MNSYLNDSERHISNPLSKNNSIISYNDFLLRLTTVTDEYLIANTHELGRANIVAFLIAKLREDEFEPDEVHILLEILMKEYIPGCLEADECYKKYNGEVRQTIN